MLKLRSALILIVIVGIAIPFALKPGLVTFSSFTSAYFVQQLTPLVLVSLFIERALEVFLTAWRGKSAADLTQKVKRARAAAGPNQAPSPNQLDAEDNLTAYKTDTQRIALPAP
jgi:Na+/proline symporter